MRERAEAGPWGLDLTLEVRLNGQLAARPPYAGTYWTAAQMLAHMTVNGASARTGDLFASGTVSGPDPDQRGCLLELSWGGAEPLTLPDGSVRSFLEDGDEVTITAAAPAADGSRIGFGEVTGRRGQAVDIGFGTGAVKVTPGHDPVDFEIGRHHGLPELTVICFDGRIPEIARSLALQGAEIIVDMANFFAMDQADMWGPARSYENGVWLVAATKAGYERSIYYPGGSMIVDPKGRVVAKMPDDRHGVIGAGLFVGSGVVINETGPAAFLPCLVEGTFGRHAATPVRFGPLPLPPGRSSALRIPPVPRTAERTELTRRRPHPYGSTPCHSLRPKVPDQLPQPL